MLKTKFVDIAYSVCISVIFIHKLFIIASYPEFQIAWIDGFRHLLCAQTNVTVTRK